MKSGGKLWTMLKSAAVLEPGSRMIRPKRVARITKVALDIPGLEPVRTSAPAATGAKQRRVWRNLARIVTTTGDMKTRQMNIGHRFQHISQIRLHHMLLPF